MGLEEDSITVAPVVVKPAIDSKSEKTSPWRISENGASDPGPVNIPPSQ
jgi:hypothetical protein